MLATAPLHCLAAGARDGASAPGAAPAERSAQPGDVPAALPPSTDLEYKTTATMQLMGLPMTLHARTSTRWRLDGGRYEMHLHMDTAEFDQSSYGTLDPDGALVPDRYEEKRPFHSAEAVQIDWAHERVQFGSAPPARAPAPGAQDRLSLQFELARQRQRYPERFVAGSTHEVNLIGTHDVDPWKFTVAEAESIDTGRGPMRAVRMSARRMVGTVEESMEIWLGADLQWMPIRIRIVDRKQSIIDSVLE
ncbi:hypothetical protein SBBP1_590042 [Burkholderiales bacterium]|nr:hypothetical protein SBBP1_590042 [Burkholderiales bacterium]